MSVICYQVLRILGQVQNAVGVIRDNGIAYLSERTDKTH